MVHITVKAGRVMKNLTQNDLAEKLGIHVQTYRRLENEPENFTIKNLLKLEEVLEIPYNDIILGCKESMVGRC